MTKSELRKKYKVLRQNLTKDDIEVESLAIANRLLELPVWDHLYYHIFLPITKQNEVDTEFILHILQGKDKHVVISKTNFEDQSLQHFLLTDQTELKTNSWGIPEPTEQSIPIAEQHIEVVFVPLLAYDKKGNRVGYGKGFYDRFLASCKPKLIIGLSFFEAEDLDIISEKFDIKMDYCINPKEIVRF